MPTDLIPGSFQRIERFLKQLETSFYRLKEG